MIEAKDISKNFDSIAAVNGLSATIKDGAVFGLIGTNGAGKSTFLRILAGILKPDTGNVTVDDLPVFENAQAKSKFFYISDEQHYFSNATPRDILKFYCAVYPKFREDRFYEYLSRFELDARRKVSTFSKGMKKQLSIICGLCSGTKYLFCDETFDGLDPVMRQGVKSIFASEMADRDFTPVIASHNLRELEDICDHVGLLHKGGILLSKDLIEMKGNIHKLQCVFQDEESEKQALEALRIMKLDRRGSLITITARGLREEIVDAVSKSSPVFYEVLPLTLEEVFISETEVVGYDVKKLIF